MTTTRTVRRWQTDAFALLTMIPTVLPAIAVLGLAGCSQGEAREEIVAPPARSVSLSAARPAVEGLTAPHRGMMQRRHVPGTSSGSGSSPAHFDSDGGRAVDGTLEYFGGRVISNVVVYEIYWGSTGFDPGFQANIGAFYTAVLKSNWWSWLAEYNTVGLNGAADNKPGSNQIIGPGTFGGAITITPSVTSTMITPTDVANELQAQMKSGVIPPLDLDAAGNVNSLYMVDFPAAIVINDMGSVSCADFCGEHQTFTMVQDGVTYSVPYSLLPDHYLGPCVAGCGSSSNPFNNATETASHELAEAVTDTEVGLTFGLGRPLGWFDAVFSPGVASGEIGDLCVGQASTVGQFTVQKLWSNLNNACISEAPLCNGSSQPPYCTPCVAADDNVGCFGATPICETDSTSTRFGQCVACTAALACPNGPTPYCTTTGADVDTCRGCTPADCTGTTSVCETSGTQAGHCVGCDATHTSSCTGSTPLCDPTELTCVGCLSNTDCSGSSPICDSSTQLCRGCVGSADCASGQICITESSNAKVGQCAACTTDADCDGNAAGPVCKAGACVAGSVPMDAGVPDAGHDSGSTTTVDSGSSSGGHADAGAEKGSSGGCSVSERSEGPWELGLVLAFGLPLLRRRRPSH